MAHYWHLSSTGLEELESQILEKREEKIFVVDRAREAMESLGIKPIVVPIRGGTDGARLSFMGLPCPNLGTGSYGHHGPYEHADVQGMDTVVEIALAILKSYAEK